MRRRQRAIAALLVAMTLPAALSASADGARGGRITKLGGTLRVGSFTFKRGTTYLVSKGLTLIASGAVEIDGPILVGGPLTIRARGPIGNNAPILPAPTRRRPAASSRGVAEPKCPATPDVTEESLPAGGKSVYGIDIREPVRAPDGRIALDGITGCPGGSVMLRTHLGPIGVAAPITAGSGAGGEQKLIHAGSSPSCSGVGGGWASEVGGGGGPGGDVTLISNPAFGGVEIHAGLQAGAGGNGGAVRAVLPATPAGHAGISLRVMTGSGGQGGSSKIVLQRPGRAARTGFVGRPGDGGSSGSAVLGPGNGGAPDCDGGNARVFVGARGGPGHGGARAAIGRGANVTVGDGNASSGPPSAGDGGNGGNLEVSPTTGGNTQDIGVVRVLNAGNGGPGADGCASTPPGPGGNGGRGGTLDAHSARTDVRGSFNGGGAGDGADPGTAGPAGRLFSKAGTRATGSFQPGADGKGCPLTSYEFENVRVEFDDAAGHNVEQFSGFACGVGPPADLNFTINVDLNGDVSATQVNFSVKNPFPLLTVTDQQNGGAATGEIVSSLHALTNPLAIRLEEQHSGTISNVQLVIPQQPLTARSVDTCSGG